MTIAKEEIFGPVMSVMKFSDINDVIKRANNTIYSLTAGLWTRVVAKAHTVASQLHAGTVWVNCYNVYDSAKPFGGFKESGQGRELSQEGLSNYTEIKTVTVSLS